MNVTEQIARPFADSDRNVPALFGPLLAIAILAIIFALELSALATAQRRSVAAAVGHDLTSPVYVEIRRSEREDVLAVPEPWISAPVYVEFRREEREGR